jgi:hypothetical protein
MPIIQFDKSASEEFGKIPAELRRIGKLTGTRRSNWCRCPFSSRHSLGVPTMRYCVHRFFGQPMQQFYLQSDIEPWVRKLGRPAILSDLITPCASVSRLVRKTLSFSKSLENHIGAIWYFVHAYNKSLLL